MDYSNQNHDWGSSAQAKSRFVCKDGKRIFSLAENILWPMENVLGVANF